MKCPHCGRDVTYTTDHLTFDGGHSSAKYACVPMVKCPNCAELVDEATSHLHAALQGTTEDSHGAEHFSCSTVEQHVVIDGSRAGEEQLGQASAQ